MAIELTPLFVGGMPGGMELAVILLIAVLLFGANKIPKLARSTGEAMGEFKKGREQVEQELQEMQEGVSDPISDSASSEPETSTDTSTDTVDADADVEADAEAETETETADEK